MKDPILCSQPRCVNNRAPQKKICYTCKSRIYNEKNPIKITFYWIKSSAKKRNIDFSLDMTEWINFIKDSGYIEKRGRNKNGLTIDRIDGSRGYSIDNIRVIKKYKNSKKYHDKEEEYPF